MKYDNHVTAGSEKQVHRAQYTSFLTSAFKFKYLNVSPKMTIDLTQSEVFCSWFLSSWSEFEVELKL